MSKTFHAQILTPNGSLFDGEVSGVQVPGSEGKFEMLFNHAPIVSTLTIGKVVIKKEDQSELVFAVNGGFIEMSDNQMTLLAEEAVEASKIDVDEARAARDAAKNKLSSKEGERTSAEKELAVAENKLKLAT
ncbi:MAG: ATP synthase F1 subunit epsilon [Balneolaceae bacterium]